MRYVKLELCVVMIALIAKIGVELSKKTSILFCQP